MEDMQMAEDAALETPPSNVYVPPSVDKPAVLAGDSFTYHSPIPPVLNPTTSTTNTTESATQDGSAAAQSVPTEKASPDSPAVCLGIDEAGRGPVLGPMVYAAFYLPIPLSDPLLREAHHFDDSKALTPAVRSSLMRSLCEALPDNAESETGTGTEPHTSLPASCGFAVRALSARDISAGMLSNQSPYNLNSQAFDATVELVRGVLARDVNVAEMYVDTVGQPAAYQARLARIFPNIKITVAKKADSLYPCVSAASVCAKVTRDAALEVLYEARAAGDAAGDGGGNGNGSMLWGSGYPSDGKCVSWLRGNMHPLFGWGPECRFSWGTAKDMLEGKGAGVKVEWPVEDDGENNRLDDYFSAGKDAKETDELGSWFGRPAGLEAF